MGGGSTGVRDAGWLLTDAGLVFPNSRFRGITAFASLDQFGTNPVVLTLRDLGDGGATAVETWTQALTRGVAFVHQEDAGFRASHVASNRQALTVVAGTTPQGVRVDHVNPANLVGIVTSIPLTPVRRLAQVRVFTSPALALALVDREPYASELIRVASPFPAALFGSGMLGTAAGEDFAEVPGAQRFALLGRCDATCSFGTVSDNGVGVAGPTPRLATASTMLMSGGTWPTNPTIASFATVNGVRFANAPLRVAADGADLVVIAGTDLGLGLRVERHDLTDGGVTSWTSTTAVRVVDAIRAESSVLLLAHFDAPTGIGGVPVPWAIQSGRNVLLIRIDRTGLSVTPFSEPGDQDPVAFAQLVTATNREGGLMIVGNEGPAGFLWRVQ